MNRRRPSTTVVSLWTACRLLWACARDGAVGEGLGVGAAPAAIIADDAGGVDGEVPRIERRHRREAPSVGVARR